MLAQVLIVPIVQLLVLSNAATFEIRDTPIYVVDLDRTQRRRGGWSTASPRRDTSGSSTRRRSLEPRRTRRCSRRRDAWSLTIPHDFEASLVRTGAAPVQLSVNAEKGSAAGIVQSYAIAHPRRVLASRARGRAAEPPHARSTAPRIDVQVRHWYNPTLNYKHYMVPGILVALVTMIGTLLTAQNIAREKELGTLEQLNVTPITRGQFITAKLLPFWVLGLVDFGDRADGRQAGVRHPDAGQPAAAVRRGRRSTWWSRWRSVSGSRRSSRRSSRRCS